MADDPNQTADKLTLMRAAVEGYKARTVRLDSKYPLATCTYCYNQSEATKNESARRIAALWNLAHGISTEKLERLDEAGFKFLRK